jgi:hypothetical protein
MPTIECAPAAMSSSSLRLGKKALARGRSVIFRKEKCDEACSATGWEASITLNDRQGNSGELASFGRRN